MFIGRHLVVDQPIHSWLRQKGKDSKISIQDTLTEKVALIL